MNAHRPTLTEAREADRHRRTQCHRRRHRYLWLTELFCLSCAGLLGVLGIGFTGVYSGFQQKLPVPALLCLLAATLTGGAGVRAGIASAAARNQVEADEAGSAHPRPGPVVASPSGPTSA